MKNGKNIRQELIPLIQASTPPYRTNVDHSVPELNECPSLPRQLEAGNILKTEIHQVLVLLFTKPLDEAVAC